MNLETEIKIRLEGEELDRLRKRLDRLGAGVVKPRAEEVNQLFDFPDGRLRKAGMALRLRTHGEQAVMTVKGKTQPDPQLKKRPETQMQVSDYGAARSILEALGLKLQLEYRKTREVRSWSLPGGELEICLDETPVGDFVELEGEPEMILKAARKLGWGPERFLRATYVELYSAGGRTNR